ncbi:MSP domain-containing protein [Caenorhabditis elegans]|uniref:MSP domain-containing protein n=1 Tax=Caenorhabditis elegans TaxID=6239 RepID=O02102_CAEEL|nr:MSP domain-containing protein [Caenorhabditis elegans]CCD65136.1 MSP domain-containing protein [Caenorhabditis elegans]|eukprot:NP_491330.1 Uncharacterized protein CELE_C18E3.1 [Caenorhabditis elegans]
MDSDEEILSSYSSLTVTSRNETTISTRDSASNAMPVVVVDDEIFEDASSDISILTKRQESSSIHLDRSKMRKAVHQDLCTHDQKILEPLFLRKCEPHRVRQGTAPPNVIPIQKVENVEANKKFTGHSALLVSLNTPTYCVRYLAANAVHTPKNVLIFASPLSYVRFVARPDPQRTNQSVFEDPSETVRLMMAPDVAKVAQKMLPKWQTVTFTLAFGKHVAVKYRIIEVRKQPVTYVKAKADRVKRVSTSTLYRTEPVQRVDYWRSFKSNELKLSTVEKNDPQIVKRVFLEQQSLNWDPSGVIGTEKEHHHKTIVKSKKIKTGEELNLMWQRTDFH